MDERCERCGFYASNPPLCGFCKSEIALRVWDALQSAKRDQELDAWMDGHPGNPANLPDPTNKEQEQREDGYAFEEFRRSHDTARS